MNTLAHLLQGKHSFNHHPPKFPLFTHLQLDQEKGEKNKHFCAHTIFTPFCETYPLSSPNTSANTTHKRMVSITDEYYEDFI